MPLFGKRKKEQTPTGLTADQITTAGLEFLAARRQWKESRHAALHNAGYNVCERCQVAVAVVSANYERLCKRCYALGIADGSLPVPDDPEICDFVEDGSGQTFLRFRYDDDLVE